MCHSSAVDSARSVRMQMQKVPAGLDDSRGRTESDYEVPRVPCEFGAKWGGILAEASNACRSACVTSLRDKLAIRVEGGGNESVRSVRCL